MTIIEATCILKYVLNQVADLARVCRLGRTKACAVTLAALRSAESWIAKLRSLSERRLDRLGDYLSDAATTSPSREPDISRGPIDQPEETQ